ncbi:MAG: hypothetical protein U1A72_16225 [Sulfuritalea sp.]|nr:hypothetical protein [Sulfuritalea sp.]
MTRDRTIDCMRLDTEEGVVSAAIAMAAAVCEDVLWPVINHTPPGMRQALFERFISGLTGAMCAEVGPERAKETLDAVKLAIDDVQRGRAHAH